MISNKNDSRIFDHDEDGHPAFTIGFHGSTSATSGNMYYVQKLWHIFTGKLVEDGKIEGNIEWDDKQFVVDAESSLLKASKKTVTHADKSIFQFVKVDNNMDCNTMLGQLNTLFDLVDPNAGDAEGVE